MAKKNKTQKAAPQAEAPAAEAAPEKPKRVGLTTKEVADQLGITPVKLRRILRTGDSYDDKGYTRYDLTPDVVERLKQAVAAGADGRTRKPRKGKKNAATEEAASEEVQEQLEELESEDEEADELELDTDSDDEEEEDEEDEDE